MYILVTYDVETSTPEGSRRLRKVARCCVNHGQRVQNSVFECEISEAMFVQFKQELSQLINPTTDSLRIYRLGKNYHTNIEHIGQQTSFEIDAPLIV